MKRKILIFIALSEVYFHAAICETQLNAGSVETNTIGPRKKQVRITCFSKVMIP